MSRSSSIDRGVVGGARRRPQLTSSSGRAGAFDALQQLIEIPDLLVGGDLTITQERGAVLEVQRSGPQVERTVGQAGDERIKRGSVLRSQTISGNPPNR